MIELELKPTEDWKPLTEATPEGHLPSAGVAHIVKAVFDAYGVHYRDALAKDWDGSWQLVTKDGKLGKRLSNYMHKKNWPNNNEKAIMDAVAQACQEGATPRLEYMITPTLKWKSGDFGDGDSCFFTWNRKYRAALQRAGAGGVLIREVTEDGQANGLARAFLVPFNGHLYMVNRYGGIPLALSNAVLDNYKDDAVREVTPVDFGMHTTTDGYVDNYFYYNGYASAFTTDPGMAAAKEPVRWPSRDLPTPTVLKQNGCKCVAVFSGRNENAVEVVCENCPFTELDWEKYRKNSHAE